MNPQDPLPEGQWLFRRIFTWSLTIVLIGLLTWIIGRMPAAELKHVALGLIALIALVVTYYLLAPSAAELARIFAGLPIRLPFPRFPNSAPPGDPSS